MEENLAIFVPALYYSVVFGVFIVGSTRIKLGQAGVRWLPDYENVDFAGGTHLNTVLVV